MTQETIAYQTIEGVDKPVSRIFYGTAALPFSAGEDGAPLLDAVTEMGINAIDTARVYGLAEKSIGDWLSHRDCREKLVLLSKCGHPDLETGRKRINEKEMREDLETSLHLLQTDYLDIYLLHRDDPDVPVGDIVEVFNAMHTEGKIHAFGGSNWTWQRIEAANEYAYAHNLIPFTVSSPNFGLADQVADLWGGGSVSISGPENKEARNWYRKNQMPVIAYSSLGHGLFSGKLHAAHAAEEAPKVLDSFAMKGYACPDNYERLRRCELLAAEKGLTVSQIAMAWIFGQPLNTFAIVSSGSPKRMQQNIDASNISLTQEECDFLDLKS